MNINIQRKIDRLIGAPLCALFSIWSRIGKSIFGDSASHPARRKILVILLSEMGSLVLAQPMFAKIKQLYPDARLYILLFKKNREVIDLLNNIPNENIKTLSDKGIGKLFQDSLRTLLWMRRVKFDVVIDCELFSRISSIFSYLSGAPVRVGFHPHTQEGLYRGSYINRPVLYNPYRHISQQFLTLVAAIESNGTPPAKGAQEEIIAPQPLPFDQNELRTIKGKLLSDFPALNDAKLVLVYPDGGVLPIRAWPTEYYKQLCAALIKAGFAVALIGLPDSKALAQQIVQHCAHERCIDLSGYTQSIRHLLAIFNHADLLITNDGGPGQLSSLSRLPTIVLFGPETPQLYCPLGDNMHYLYTALSCSPCLTAYNHRNSMCDGNNICLKLIEPKQVLDKSLELLKK